MIPALTFDRKRFIGVVHLKPLPASPRFAGSVDAILNAALADATAYQRGGADAIFIENFGDVPFTKGAVGTETVAAMPGSGRAVLSRISVTIGSKGLWVCDRAPPGLCAV